MSCHKVNLSNLHIKLYTRELELLQKGYLAQAQDLTDRFLNSEKGEDIAIDEIDSFFRETLNGMFHFMSVL